MALCEVSLLGGFAVRVDGRQVPDNVWRRSRVAGLVKLLALADGHRLLRDQAADLLWPDLPAAAASANLRKAVHYARLGLGGAAAIKYRGAMLELFPAGVVVDAEVFERAARQALRQGAGHLAAAVLYHGELLPEDRYAGWAEAPRDRLRRLHLELLRGAGRWQEVLAVEPSDELAHRALMKEALDAGDRAAAVRQFELLRRQLRADLGVGPDRESTTLYERALAMGPAAAPTTDEIAQSLLARALIHLNSGELADSARAAAWARSLAIDAHLGREAGEASAVLGMLANMRGEWRDGFRAEFRDAVERDPHVASFLLDAHACLAEFSLSGPGGHAGLTDLAAELTSCARRAASVHGEAVGTLLAGEIALHAGRLHDALITLTRAQELFERAGASSGLTLCALRLADHDVAVGDPARAARRVRKVMAAARTSWLASHLVVRAHGLLVATSPDARSAVRRVHAADLALRGTPVCPPCSFGYLLAASVAMARAHVLPQARGRMADAERLAGMWPSGAAHAALWEARAVVRRIEGDRVRARAFFLEAADRYEQVGRPLERDRCRTLSAVDRRDSGYGAWDREAGVR